MLTKKTIIKVHSRYISRFNCECAVLEKWDPVHLLRLQNNTYPMEVTYKKSSDQLTTGQKYFKLQLLNQLLMEILMKTNYSIIRRFQRFVYSRHIWFLCKPLFQTKNILFHERKFGFFYVSRLFTFSTIVQRSKINEIYFSFKKCLIINKNMRLVFMKLYKWWLP